MFKLYLYGFLAKNVSDKFRKNYINALNDYLGE